MTPSAPTPPKPPVDSQREHRRQSFWQITFPLLVVLLLMGAGLALLVINGEESIARATDVATSFAILPVLLLCVVFIALPVVLVVALGQALDFIPPYTQIAQKYTARVAEFVQKATKRITDLLIPVITGFSMVGRMVSGENGKEDEHDERDE